MGLLHMQFQLLFQEEVSLQQYISFSWRKFATREFEKALKEKKQTIALP